jgi:hypothetical protein
MKKRKNVVRARTLAFSLLLFMVLTYARPVEARGSNVSIKTISVQVDGKMKNEFKKGYQAKKKVAKAEYRKTVKSLKEELANALSAAKSKGERLEARRKFKEGLKAADLKLTITLKEAKEQYKKEISD